MDRGQMPVLLVEMLWPKGMLQSTLKDNNGSFLKRSQVTYYAS